MTAALFRAMFLSLLHDRGALVMAFVLPVLFFLVMAEIFSGAAVDDMQIQVAIADEADSELSARLVNALLQSPVIDAVAGPDLSRADVEQLVRRGTADVGLVLRADARALDNVAGFGPAPLVVISDPARGVTVPMLAGQIQKAYFEALPDVALGSVVNLIEDQFVALDESQQADIAAGLAEMRGAAMAGGDSGWSFGDMIERFDVAGQSEATNYVSYYAGAVAFLFLLFASMQGAVSLAEERESGVFERIMAGPGGIAVLVNGKFLFLVGQGFVQMGLIFVTAWLFYGVDLPGNLIGWTVITLLACAAAAGMSLLIAAACHTPVQVQNLSTILFLIFSVVGGSMVPRFFMPPWLRELGWFTPNTWVLEAYSTVFWRGEGVGQALVPCALLGAIALVCLFAAQLIAGWRARV